MVKNFYIMLQCLPQMHCKWFATASKKAIQKTAVTGDLIGSKMADRITEVSKPLQQYNS